MSPRKSSTSSGKGSSRPRYLGIEVAGDPSFSTRWLETALADRLRAACPDPEPARVRLIRREGARAVVELDHRRVPAARGAWNAAFPSPSGRPVEIATVRSWGTLRGAKVWIRGPLRRVPRAVTPQ
ncbi:MAG: hypothetical protein L3K01_07665 [Thermoplasmata archaeon]|nr:hypothetical protein [Thermoplasmata archaeon]